MKKLISFIIILILMINLVACGEKAVPIENPQPELFSDFYKADGFTVLKRIDIVPNKAYTTLGYIVISDKGSHCMIGSYHIHNYMVFYNEKYYNLQEGAKLNIYNGNDLVMMGFDDFCTTE